MDKQSKYLFDIQSSIHLIELFTQDIYTFEQYMNDIKTQSAVERQLGIIGEAANKIRQEDAEILSQIKQIVDFRNRIIHSYDNIDANIVWVIIKKYLPILKSEVDKKLIQ